MCQLSFILIISQSHTQKADFVFITKQVLKPLMILD